MASKLSLFLVELKRRKVYRVAAIYTAVGVAISLAVPDLFGALLLPGWATRLVIVLIAIGFPIALVLAWAYEVKPEEPRLTETTPAKIPVTLETEREKSIVVLPFENLSPDPDNAFFADGLTEELIADLSKVKALKVISRTSAMTFKGTAMTVPAIARELNVRFALEGSVRREAGSLRITAQLIEAASDAHLWAEKYSGTVEDVFDLQERLSRRIVDALKVTLSPEEDRRLASRPIADSQAHDIWLRARQHVLTGTDDGLERGRDLVEQALSLAGDNALLHATLGWIHAVRWGQLEDDVDNILSLARKHATRAMELDPDLPWSLLSLAVVRLREADLQGFVRWGNKVLEIERDSHTLAVLSLYLAYAGRMEPAKRFAEEAASLDPLSWLTAHAVPHADLYAGNATLAFHRMRELAERLAPGEPWPAFEVGYAALQAGLDDEAHAWLRQSSEGGSPFYSRMSQLLVHLVEDDEDSAKEDLRTGTLTQVAGRIGYGSYLVGTGFAKVGNVEKAFEWLERGIDQGFTNHRFMSEHDILLASVREMPGFEAVVSSARKREAGLEL